jgi:hypothetical protein
MTLALPAGAPLRPEDLPAARGFAPARPAGFAAGFVSAGLA